jgi:RHS repeat-associated protein
MTCPLRHGAQARRYDFLARQYDAALGRWFGVDAMADNMPGFSPYNAMANNPVMFVDPDGNEPFTIAALGFAILKGALIGAGTSAAAYGLKTTISGSYWNWSQFGNSVGRGALIGAITGGTLNTISQLTQMGAGASGVGAGAKSLGGADLSGGGMPVKALGSVSGSGVERGIELLGQGGGNSMMSSLANNLASAASCSACIDLPSVTIEALRGFGAAQWYKMVATGLNPVLAGVYSSRSAFMDNPVTQGAIVAASSLVGGGIAGQFLRTGARAANVGNAARGARTFFEGAKYSDKVLRQMDKADDIYHAFPKSVDGFATKFGQWSTKVGADGKTYQWLRMNGSFGGKTGTFEYIKDAHGIINHRFFNISKFL